VGYIHQQFEYNFSLLRVAISPDEFVLRMWKFHCWYIYLCRSFRHFTFMFSE